MARFTQAGGSGSGTPGPQGPQGPAGEDAVLPQDLGTTDSPTFSKITLTSNGATDNITIGDDVILGDGNIANHVVIIGQQDATQGGIVLGSNETESISTDSTNLSLTANNDIVLNPGSTYAYIGTPQLDGSNRIAKMSDITGGSGANIADFIFTNDSENTGRSIISLPGDKGMTIEAGVDSDLYITAGDDLYIQTLGQGDDIHLNAADDIRFTTNNEDSANEPIPTWRMNSEGLFELPGDGYISNPYAETITPQTNVVIYYDNYLNDQSGLNQANSVLLPVDGNTLWFVGNNNITSPVVVTFADSTSAQLVAIYDATSQGTPAIVFQWNDQDRTKTYAETFPLTISADYNQITYGPSVIVLDPQWIGNDQKLVIDATAPNHIHVRAGGTIDASTADLILGGENTNVVVSDGQQSVVIKGDNGEFLNYVSANNQIATIGDLGAGANGEVTRWSPNFEATGLVFTGTDTTYPTYNSHYVKNGRMVSFWIAIDLSTVTNFGTGQYITALPYAPLAGTMNHFQAWANVDPTVNPDIAGHVVLQADHLANTTQLDLHYLKQAGGANSPLMEAMFTQDAPAELTTSSKIYINGTYITAE